MDADDKVKGMKNFVNSPSLRGDDDVKEAADDPKKLVEVGQDDEWINIRIAKRLVREIGPNKTMAMVKLVSGNLFTPSREKAFKKGAAGKSCAFFAEGRQHYTGGRYSVFAHAVLLSQIMEVTWLTDEPLPFEKDFDHKIRIIEDPQAFSRKLDDLGVDFVVGLPNLSGQASQAYAERFNIPSFLVMFESPNFIREFRSDGNDAREEYWTDYKKCLYHCDGVICHSHTSAKYVTDWLMNSSWMPEDAKIPPTSVVHPTWNDVVFQCANVLPGEKEREGVVFCSRSVPFKDPYEVLTELDKLGFKEQVNVIGKTWNSEKYGRPWTFPLVIWGTVSDVDKFDIMKRSKVLAMPSKFEGFGMPPMEGLICGADVIAYKLPSLEEVYGDNITYVGPGNAKRMAEMIRDMCVDGPREDLEICERVVKQKLSPRRALSSLKMCLPGPLTLSVGIMAYDMVEWVEKAIRNAAEYADQIIIVHGRCKDYPEVNNSDEATRDIICKLYNELDVDIDYMSVGKVDTKVDLQNAIAKKVKCDIYMKQDADEFWFKDDIELALAHFDEDPELDIMAVPFIHFWKNLGQVAKDAGGKWSAKHPRFWRWRRGFHHGYNHNVFNDNTGHEVSPPDYKSIIPDENITGIMCYHTGYVRDVEAVQRKLAFYGNRGIEKVVKDTYTKWRKGRSTQPTQDVRSWAEEWSGGLPEILKNGS